MNSYFQYFGGFTQQQWGAPAVTPQLHRFPSHEKELSLVYTSSCRNENLDKVL